MTPTLLQPPPCDMRHQQDGAQTSGPRYRDFLLHFRSCVLVLAQTEACQCEGAQTGCCAGFCTGLQVPSMDAHRAPQHAGTVFSKRKYFFLVLVSQQITRTVGDRGKSHALGVARHFGGTIAKSATNRTEKDANAVRGLPAAPQLCRSTTLSSFVEQIRQKALHCEHVVFVVHLCCLKAILIS